MKNIFCFGKKKLQLTSILDGMGHRGGLVFFTPLIGDGWHVVLHPSFLSFTYFSLYFACWLVRLLTTLRLMSSLETFPKNSGFQLSLLVARWWPLPITPDPNRLTFVFWLSQRKLIWCLRFAIWGTKSKQGSIVDLKIEMLVALAPKVESRSCWWE